ncbi:MAG: hypothetical protein ACRELB_22235, partial [Polyangiaceae bacterium]
MSRRTLLYLGLAASLVVVATLLRPGPSRSSASAGEAAPAGPAPDGGAAGPGGPSGLPFPVPEAAPPVPFRKPPAAVAEYGVLTARTEEELKP